MANSTPILAAIKAKDWTTATQQVTVALEQKVAERLAQERVTVGKTLVKEANYDFKSIIQQRGAAQAKRVPAVLDTDFVELVQQKLAKMGLPALLDDGMHGTTIYFDGDGWEGSTGTLDATEWVGALNFPDQRKVAATGKYYIDFKTGADQYDKDVNRVADRIYKAVKQALAKMQIHEGFLDLFKRGKKPDIRCGECFKKFVGSENCPDGDYTCPYCGSIDVEMMHFDDDFEESVDVAWSEAAGDKCDDCGKADGEVLTDSGKTVCKACAHKRGMATFRSESAPFTPEKWVTCPACKGAPRKPGRVIDQCPVCYGDGKIPEAELKTYYREAWEKDPNCAQCRKPLSASDAKLGTVCGKCASGNKTKIYAKEESLPHKDIQRIFDETGDIAETELICGVSDVKVNAQGDVVSYVAEDTEEDRAYRRTYGWDRKGKVIFSAPGRLTLDDVKEVSPEVVKIDVRGDEYSGDEDRHGFANFNLYKDWGRPKEIVARLARIGVPAEPSYSPYVDMVAVSVPTKYVKKAGKELYGESHMIKEEKEKLLCHDCGNVWMGDFPAKCPECGCRKCVRTDEPLSEALNTMRTRSVRLLAGK